MEEVKNTVSQEQIEDLLYNREIGWQEIIYDLINTEQLDPWNVDIAVLSEGFLRKIQEYEEMDFFVSSKVLLAAALLLRIKSEMILSRYMKSIDAILFGEEEKSESRDFEKIELDEEIPELVLRTPLPRFKRVTLKELIESLNKAIATENRRIKKVIVNKNALRETGISLPKKKESIKERIKFFRNKILNYFRINSQEKRVLYEEIVGLGREERALSLFPLLELEREGELWLEQKEVFGEIFIWLGEVFFRENPTPYEDLKNGEWEESDYSQAEVLSQE